MENKTRSLKFLRKRKFLMVLPLLALPFITLLFWSLGGGKGQPEKDRRDQDRGLNTKLPKAKLNDESFLDKLSFYEKANIDSAHAKELRKYDPYYRNGLEFGSGQEVTPDGSQLSGLSPDRDPNEEKVYQKVAELNQQLAMPQKSRFRQNEDRMFGAQQDPAGIEMDRLETLLNSINTDTARDPQMDQINSTLDKIIKVQNPRSTLQDRLSKQAGQPRAIPAKLSRTNVPISLLQSVAVGINNKPGVPRQNDFLSMQVLSADTTNQFGIACVVYTTQSVVNGSVIRLRILEDLEVDGQRIQAGQSVYGNVQLENERLRVSIRTIRKGNNIYPVKLKVYDVDGLEGISIPGAITRDVAKESSTNTIQNLELFTMDQSLSSQAGKAGLSAIKTLLARKAKLIKVTVKDGYQLVLQDDTNLF
ncbi:conjugative transposon protein TraM [Segetibacter sp. 3557_3]|uniref:conjugative transposon protein TraM n=1 Tax=Segetibacter sp. 3557_3 TaxID=2547429 RepID=UPI001058BEE8|nr:conjugative transposon protein TraM [Segetibacter sp. 3557_3]TDH18045.1 conjugative transposon protein TraM [Segetibacter sp. 3557_3]